LNELTYDVFARQLHTRFGVHLSPDRTVALELIEAQEIQSRPRQDGRPAPDANYEKFSLLFAGALDDALPQQIHRFGHDEIGQFEMFIVPVMSKDPKRRWYEANFNRPRSGQPANPSA